MTKSIPIKFVNPIECFEPGVRGALKWREAMLYLGIGETKLWRLAATGQIVKTSYNTYPVTSLNAHLERETARHRRRV